MKILVTGASGYIGSALIRRLVERGHNEIHALDLCSPSKGLANGLRVIDQDLTLRDELERNLKDRNIDVLVHLAAKIRGSPHEVIRTNVIGTENILHIMSERQPRLILVASTAAQLYGNAKYMPIDEMHPVAPQTPYGLSKYLMEEVVNYYHRVYGLPTLIFRQANIYGPSPNPKLTVINRFVEQSFNPNSITIHGNGKQVRNFLHIDDLVEYYMRAIFHKNPKMLAGKTLNVAGPQERQIVEIAEITANTVSEETGRKVKIVHITSPNPPNEIYSFKISSKNAQKLLKYESKIAVKEGIAELVDRYMHARISGQK